MRIDLRAIDFLNGGAAPTDFGNIGRFGALLIM